MANHYERRGVIHLPLRGYYVKHVSAMTAEGLHDKHDIAAELAWRDMQIDNLRRENERLRVALLELRNECDAMQGPELREDTVWGPLLREADAALEDE